MKRRGRPSKRPQERRDAVLRVRMTPEEYERFAVATGERSMSDVVRGLIQQYVREVEKRKTAKSWRTW